MNTVNSAILVLIILDVLVLLVAIKGHQFQPHSKKNSLRVKELKD